MKQALLIVALAALGGAAAPVQHSDLSGHWVFNKGQSDNPRNMMSARDSGGGGAGGAGGAAGCPGDAADSEAGAAGGWAAAVEAGARAVRVEREVA